MIPKRKLCRKWQLIKWLQMATYNHAPHGLENVQPQGDHFYYRSHRLHARVGDVVAHRVLVCTAVYQLLWPTKRFGAHHGGVEQRHWCSEYVGSNCLCFAILTIVGCVVCGALREVVGSVVIVQIAAAIWVGGTAVAVLLSNLYMVVIARVLKGTSMGFISTVMPVYVAEAIPANKKGTLLSVVQFSSTLGTFTLYYVGNLFQARVGDDYSFRYTWLVESVPALILFALSFFLPESPVWYAARAKWQKAARVLDRFHQQNNILDKSKRDNLGDKGYVLSAFTAEPEVRTSSYADLFGKRYWRYTMVGLCTQLIVQLLGVPVLMYFFVFMCELCGLHGEHKAWSVSSQYLVLVVFTVFPILLLDSCRRKDLVMFGLCMLGCSYVTIWALILAKGTRSVSTLPTNSPFDWLLQRELASTIIALFVFLVATYSSSILCAGWLYTGEIFPLAVRAKGTLICMCASWLLNMSLTVIVPAVLPHIGFWIFGAFGVFCFVSMAVLTRFPETRDLGYSRLESLYAETRPKRVESFDESSSATLTPLPLKPKIETESSEFNRGLAKVETQHYLSEADKVVMRQIQLTHKLLIPAVLMTTAPSEIHTAKKIKSMAMRNMKSVDDKVSIVAYSARGAPYMGSGDSLVNTADAGTAPAFQETRSYDWDQCAVGKSEATTAPISVLSFAPTLSRGSEFVTERGPFESAQFLDGGYEEFTSGPSATPAHRPDLAASLGAIKARFGQHKNAVNAKDAR